MGTDQLHYRRELAHTGVSIEHSVYRIGSYHSNWHTDYELLLVRKGSVEVCAGGSCAHLDEDDLILINPNEGHASLGLGQENTAMVIHVAPAFFKPYFAGPEHVQLLARSDAATRNDPAFVEMRRCLAEMMLLHLHGDAVSLLRSDAALYRLMATIACTAIPEQTAAPTYRLDGRGSAAIDRLVQYVENHYRERITLSDLARTTGYNANYISQLFREKLGINFSRYLTRVRLAAATIALSSGSERISDIAAEYGFSDLKSFNAAFRKTFNKTPAEYRALLSDDNRAGDSAFKQVFIPADDAAIGKKLASYVAAGDRTLPAPAGTASQLDTAALAQTLEQIGALVGQACALL